MLTAVVQVLKTHVRRHQGFAIYAFKAVHLLACPVLTDLFITTPFSDGEAHAFRNELKHGHNNAAHAHLSAPS